MIRYSEFIILYIYLHVTNAAYLQPTSMYNYLKSIFFYSYYVFLAFLNTKLTMLYFRIILSYVLFTR